MSPPSLQTTEKGLEHYEAYLRRQGQSQVRGMEAISQSLEDAPRTQDGRHRDATRRNQTGATAQEPTACLSADAGSEYTHSVPTEAEILELSEICLEGGIALTDLAKKAEVGKIRGSVLDASNVAAPRIKAIRWFTSRFSSLGYRDEWLADAVSYMDRLAVNMHTCDEMPQMQGRSKQAAAWTMSCESLWMASVYIALKMSEAESEVDLALIDLLSPLVPLKEGETKLSRQRLTQIKKDEIFIARRLDFRLMVPTALELVQHMSREICRHVPKCQESAWGGLKIMRLPQLLGPPMKNQTEEEQKKKALPARPLCMLQVMASFLVELAIVHRPGIAYGDELPIAALAVAAMQLALYSFGNEPPQSSSAKLLELQDELGLPANLTEDSQSALTADLYRLWSNVQDTSPVLQKWKQRIHKDDPDGILPAAPAKATLPQNLRDSLDFNTPQRRQQKAQDYSATPGRMEKPEKEICTPTKVPAPPELRGFTRQLPEQVGADQEEPPVPAQQLNIPAAETPPTGSGSATWQAVGDSPAATVPIARSEAGSSPNAASPAAAPPQDDSRQTALESSGSVPVLSSETPALSSEPTVAIASQPAPAPTPVPQSDGSSSDLPQPAPAPVALAPFRRPGQDLPQPAPAPVERTEKPGPGTALAPFRRPGQELARSTDERSHEGTVAGSQPAGQRKKLLLTGRAAKILAEARDEDPAPASNKQGEEAATKKRPLATPMQAFNVAENRPQPYVGDRKMTRSKFNETGQLKEPVEDTKSVGMASNSLGPARTKRSRSQLEKLQRVQSQGLPIERESQRQRVLSDSDDERDERQEPPDEESSYQPSDEGSDCGTDGIVKNRRRVKARRGNPKSASRHRGVKKSQANSKSKPRPAPSRTRGDLQLRNLQAGVARKPFATERPSLPHSVVPRRLE